MSLHSIKSYFISENRLLCLMLITLITAITLGLDTALAKSLLITHFGLFLLWQPIYKQEDSYKTFSLIILIVSMTAFITWVNLWTTTFWVLLLSSLLNGRIFARGLNRATYGLAVIILFLELILVITPDLFNLPGMQQTTQRNINILLMLTLPLFLIPTKTTPSSNVDFIRGFMIVLLTLFLCMGSVIATLTTEQNYLYSLAATTMIAALFLFSASYLWAPRAGFSGIAQLWQKYLLNIGGPFEEWISKLAVIEISTKIDPDTFLQIGIKNLLERHWVAGINWKTELNEQLEGKTSKYTVTYDDPELKLTLYSNNVIGSALVLHSRLLLSVLTFYYRAKLQERQLINQAHIRAVYETGSKLTHDIKNILQSTQALTQVAQSGITPGSESSNILQKQLVLLTQRLKSTLEKLSSPNRSEVSTGSLKDWWQQIRNRYADRSINFIGNLNADHIIDIDVFDSITENIIENARQKRFVETEIEITVSLECNEKKFELLICDSGTPIADTVEKLLFKTVVSSENGYGIGLYQSYKQAKKSGYHLQLKHNELSRVCFLLTNKNIT